MVTPGVEKTLNGVLSPVDIILVDFLVLTGLHVELTHPLAEGMIPVVKVVLISPGGVVAKSRIIISVLAALDGVNVEQHLDVVLLGGVEEPGDLVLGTLGAANVGAVRLEGPVTDWESYDLDVSGGHLDEGILSDPLVPVLTKDGVALIGSKGLAESVLVHADTLRVSLAEESVEEGWGDPWLEDLPATDVGTDHGFLVSGLLGKSSGGKGRNSEGLH